MSSDISVTVLRSGEVVAQHEAMQLDNMSSHEASYHGGEAPYLRYWGFPITSTVFVKEDLLQDEDIDDVDPKTGVPRRYRVINDPESFPDGHWELVLDRVIGTPN